MNPELDRQLCQKYPLIFQNRHGKPSETNMCWGFQCDDGWYDLIDTLCRSIQNEIDWSINDQRLTAKWNLANPGDQRDVQEPISQVVATQVKEKFGGLRFYYTGGVDYIDAIVLMAESMSYKICEVTGNRGFLHQKMGWFKTLSPELLSQENYSGFVRYNSKEMP